VEKGRERELPTLFLAAPRTSGGRLAVGFGWNRLSDGLLMHTFFFALRALICTLLLLTPPSRPSGAEELSNVFVDSEGRVHLTGRAGGDRLAPKLKDQISVRDAKLAPDMRTAGWLVEYENCCTSYPIPLTLVLYRNGRIRREIRPGQMIYDWRFREGGRETALCEGTVHGKVEPHCLLYDCGSGKLLEEWRGGGEAPGWATGLRRE